MVEWLRVGENALYGINPLNKYTFFLNFQLAEPALTLGGVGSLPRAEEVSKYQKKNASGLHIACTSNGMVVLFK